MPLTPTARARMYRIVGGREPADNDPSVLTVQFNPTSLSHTVQNTLRQPERDPRAAQYVSQTSAKLEFDLVFDSTHDGHDVRKETARVKEFLNAGEHQNPEQAAPPLVGFRWGAFKFKGYVESFRESLELFSSDGVPLRSTLKLSMAAQNASAIFTDETFDRKARGMDPANTQLVTVPSGGTSQMGGQGGNPRAGRALAAANGFESMRNPGAAVAAVASGGVQLKSAASFSAGAGVSLGAKASVSAGGGASAGIPASAGAFAGLGPSRTSTTVALDTRAFQARGSTATVASEFAVGGRAVASASSGLKTDVGATARIRFD